MNTTHSSLIKILIACEMPDVFSAEQSVSVLAQAGHNIVLLGVRHGFFDSVCLEVAVGSNQSRAYIDISADFKEDTKTVEQMYVQKYYPQNAENIRRLICVRAWKHADTSVISALVAHFCTQCKGKIFRSAGDE